MIKIIIRVALLVCLLSGPAFAFNENSRSDSEFLATQFLKYMSVGEKSGRDNTQNQLYVMGAAMMGSSVLTENPSKFVPLVSGALMLGIGHLWGGMDLPATRLYEKGERSSDISGMDLVKELKQTYVSQRYVEAGVYLGLALVDRSDTSYTYPSDIDRLWKTVFLGLAVYTVLNERPLEVVCQSVLDNRASEKQPFSVYVGPYREQLAAAVVEVSL